MILELVRRWSTGDTTTGTLTVDGAPECFTLEDLVRTAHGEDIHRVKVAGATAIPAGTYAVTMYDSPRHGRVPLLHDVPDFTMVEIHGGNTAKDTQGCILVGQKRHAAAIEQSQAALGELVKKVERAVEQNEPVTITIRELFEVVA